MKRTPKTPKARFKVPMAEIRWLMGRVYVGTPDSEVEAEARRRIELARENGVNYTEKQAAKIVAAFLKAHRENQAEYSAVMRGF